jgi:methionyl-tRNA formyltransferase
LDSAPGAWTILNNEKVKLFGSQPWNKPKPDGDVVEIKGLNNKGIIHPEGLLITCKDGSMVSIVDVYNSTFLVLSMCLKIH